MDRFRFDPGTNVSQRLESTSGELEPALHEFADGILQFQDETPVLSWSARTVVGTHTLEGYLSLGSALGALVTTHGLLTCTVCNASAGCVPWHSLVRESQAQGVLLFVVKRELVPELSAVEYYVSQNRLLRKDEVLDREALDAVITSVTLPLAPGEEERVAHTLAALKLGGRLVMASRDRKVINDIGFFPFQCSCSNCGVRVPIESLRPRDLCSSQFEYRLGGMSLKLLLEQPVSSLLALLEKSTPQGAWDLRKTLSGLCDFGLGELSLSTKLEDLELTQMMLLDGSTMARFALAGVRVIVEDLWSYVERDRWPALNRAVQLLGSKGARLHVLGGPSARCADHLDALAAVKQRVRTDKGPTVFLTKPDQREAATSSRRVLDIEQLCEQRRRMSGAQPLLVASGFHDLIAPHFSSTIEARVLGITADTIAFPHGSHLCRYCTGAGRTLAVADVTAMLCPECRGQRYGPEAAELIVQGIRLGELWSRRCRDLPESVFATDAEAELYRYFIDIGFGEYRAGFPFQRLFLAERRRITLFRSLLTVADPAAALWILEGLSPGLSPSRVRVYIGLLERIRGAGAEIMAVESVLEDDASEGSGGDSVGA